MFKLKMNDSKVVKGIFDAVAAIISETHLKVTASGITLTSMDLSHICLVSLTLNKDDLDEFETDGEYELGINLEDLVKIIRRSTAEDAISFSHDPKAKKLLIEMVPESGKKKRKFTLALIDVEGEEIKMDQLEAMEYINMATMDIKIIDEAIKDADIFGDILQVKVSKEKVLNFATTGNMGTMDYDVESDLLEDVNFGEASEGVYALSFLKNMLKASAITNTVAIGFKSEAPLKMQFDFTNMVNSRILYFLAPRVEEDDDGEMYED